ncbi:MAG: ISNCY family transposase [Anaerolineae bacterium]|nr:ISNCY family transposase [Anaerolineae bacterium]
METLLTMSGKEVSKLEVMQRLKEKSLKQREAAKILGVSVRHVKRMFKAYREQGAAGLVSQRRGRESNNRLNEVTRVQALDLLGSKYRGFGPTLACEKLVEVEGLKISKESVRKMMLVEGLWKARRVRKIVTHQMRERRPCLGELVQIDGSPHAWFEERAPGCVLLVFIDDATGKLLQLLFVESESFFSYCLAAQTYFERHGKPVAFYSDKHGIFRVNMPNSLSGDNLTQFGRAMQELDIQIICANTLQAKGRVERANQTLQDRLVKEMRLRGISSREAGNAYLPEFIADFNQRFAVQPISQHDAHRPLTTQDDLAHILTWQEHRTLSKNLTVQFEKVVYQIQTERPTYAMRNAGITVCKNASGNISLLYKHKPLPYTTFHKQAKQAEVVETKDLDGALTLHQRVTQPPAPDHIWRQYGQHFNGKPIQKALPQTTG